MENELKVIDKRMQEGTEVTMAVSVVELAMQKNYTPELIEKMMALQERHEANEAKKAYTKAMANFKKNAPEIEKDRLVSYKAGGQTVEYRHASLANVCKKISSALGEHGLHASWQTEQTNGDIKVTCTITHEQGHSEAIYLTAKPDTSGSKNAIQAIGSTISYLERYTLLALTGLATHDMDDDGQGSEVEHISEKQIETVNKIIEEKNIDTKAFFEYMKIEKIEDIQTDDFNKAMGLLKKAKGRQSEKTYSCPELDGKEVVQKICDKCEVRDNCPAHD